MALTDHFTVQTLTLNNNSDTLTCASDTGKITLSTLATTISLSVGGTLFLLPASKPLVISNANLRGMTLTFDKSDVGDGVVTMLEHRGQQS